MYKKILFEFIKPFNLIPEFKAKIGEISERSPAAGGASEPLNRPKESQRLVWQGRQDSNLEQKFWRFP